MKKRFRRSAVSVVLAVALLLSQHSMLAFAADGDLSLDASNEPPVQVAQVTPVDEPVNPDPQETAGSDEVSADDGEEQKSNDQQETAGSDKVSADDGGNKEKTVAQQSAVSDVSTAAPVALAAAPVALAAAANQPISLEGEDTPAEVCEQKANFAPGGVTISNISNKAISDVQDYLKNIGFPCEGHYEHNDNTKQMHFTSEATVLSILNNILKKHNYEVDSYKWEHDNSGDKHTHGTDGQLGHCWEKVTGNSHKLTVTVKPITPDPEDPDKIPEGWADKIKVEVECDDDDDSSNNTCEHCGKANHDCEKHGCDDDGCDNDLKGTLSELNVGDDYYTTSWDKDTNTLTVTFDDSHGEAWANKFHLDVAGENGCKCDSHFFCSYDDDEDDDNEHQQSVTVILKYDETAKTWSVTSAPDTEDNGNAKVKIDVHCNGESKPEEPKPINPITDGLVNVVVKCITLPDDHTESETMALVDETYTSTWNDETTPTEVTVTLKDPQKDYVDAYKPGEKEHKAVVEDGKTYSVKLEWKEVDGKYCWAIKGENENFTAVTAESPATITVEATCIPAIDVNTLKLGVQMYCVTNSNHEHTAINALTKDDTAHYTITADESDPTKATITITASKYLEEYNNGKDVTHALSTETPYTIPLEYSNNQWQVGADNIWTSESDYNAVVKIPVRCENKLTPDIVKSLLKARVICVDNGTMHTNFDSNPGDLIDGSFEITHVIGEGFVYNVTVKNEQYVEEFNNTHNGITHELVTDSSDYPVTDGSVTVTFSCGTNGEWHVQGKTATDITTVTFPVKCTAQPPEKPTPGEVEPLFASAVTVFCRNTTVNHPSRIYAITEDQFTIGDVYSKPSITKAAEADYFADVTITANDGTTFFNQYYNDTGHTLTDMQGNISKTIVKLKYDSEKKDWKVDGTAPSFQLSVTCTTGGTTPTPDPDPDPTPTPDPDPTPTPTPRTIEDEPVPLAELPDDVVDDTVTIEDEEVPLAELPDDLITIEDEEVPLKGNPFTGDSLPFAAMAAAAISFCGILAFGRRKK